MQRMCSGFFAVVAVSFLALLLAFQWHVNVIYLYVLMADGFSSIGRIQLAKKNQYSTERETCNILAGQ